MTPLDARRLLALGAVVSVLGIAIAGTAPVAGTPGSSRTPAQQVLGGVVLLVGWGILAWAIHRFGRGEPATGQGEGRGKTPT